MDPTTHHDKDTKKHKHHPHFKRFLKTVGKEKSFTKPKDNSVHDAMRKEYQERGCISDPAIVKEAQTYNPWQFPEDPFDYVGLVSNVNGIGTIPSGAWGTKVAIIGAGASGLSAAYELLRIGLTPVIYEATDRIGGRNYTYNFPGDPNAQAEIGSMRIPPIHVTAFWYLNLFNIQTKPFPDPLTVPTMIYFNGKSSLYDPKNPDSLPKELQEVNALWGAFIQPFIDQMAKVWDDPNLRIQQWFDYVKEYADKSFFQVLNEYPNPPWTQDQIALFGSMGVGSGGFDSLFQISFIELLRIIVCQWETDQQLIVGGTSGFENGFWNTVVNTPLGPRSLAQVNNNTWKPAVTSITTGVSGNMVAVKDVSGQINLYNAVILSPSTRAIEMGITINQNAFDQDTWRAIRNIHQMTSGKIFIRTATAWWNQPSPQYPVYMTITDVPFRQMYLFDFPNTNSGVMLLSYTWDDSAIKFDALNDVQRVQVCLNNLAQIYPPDTVAYIQNNIQEIKTWNWEEQQYYYGAFKLTYPGQYSQQWQLFLQGRWGNDNGLYLAGESTSWAGGWTEGALHSGLLAAMSVVTRLGGTVNDPSQGTKKINMKELRAEMAKKAKAHPMSIRRPW